MAYTAVGYFRDRDQASAAYTDLLANGFSREDVSVMSRGAEDKAGQAPEGAGHEHVTPGEGAAAGGLVGLLLGAAAMLIPGIGPIVAVGPLAAGLAGAVTGGVTGTVVGGLGGALTRAGVPEHDARYYEERFKEGGVLLSVQAGPGTYEIARAILERHGGDVRSAADARPGTAAPSDRGDQGDQGAQRTELRAEQLAVHKEEREAGEVRVRKEVEQVPGRAEAEAFREEVRLRHVPINQVVSERVPSWEEDGALIVPVYEEQLVLVKQLVLKEHLRIERVRIVERREFQDTVQRERVVVDDGDKPGLVREEWPSPSERPPVPSAPQPQPGPRQDTR